MILISHRGNLNGRYPNKENHPDYIFKALKEGYHVEIDVWFKKDKFFLGHDEPTYDFPFDLIQNYSRNLWIHCKNLEAILQFNRYFDEVANYINYFWHEKDQVTLTSKGYLWAYPGVNCAHSIAVLPELKNDNVNNRIGICSDFISTYKNLK